MSGAFEGDLIRPLGLLTLYFAYAEYELDQFLEHLSPLEPFDEAEHQWQVGRKLSQAQELVRRLHNGAPTGFDDAFSDARTLFERRNVLIHSCVFDGGRMVSSCPGVPEGARRRRELTDLAERIFHFKEELRRYRWKHIEPLLAKLRTVGP